MFMGAINAYTGEAGKGLNALTGESGQGFSRIARDYKAKGVKWVVIGDSNYGEGSSREHAALSPRLLGGAAVVARSFARIHESNLKKQGLLALTFSDQADYDRIREDDRISLTGLKDMAPGKPVQCTVKHSDGTTETLELQHSYSESQLQWFQLGSALNLFHQ
jgi:aconitate hydratase